MAFVGRHRSEGATHGELEELGNLGVALKKQWSYVRAMVTSENPEVLRGSDNVVSAMEQAVGDALMSSRRFIRESLAKSWEAATTGIGRDAQGICDRAAPDIVLEDEVIGKVRVHGTRGAEAGVLL